MFNPNGQTTLFSPRNSYNPKTDQRFPNGFMDRRSELSPAMETPHLLTVCSADTKNKTTNLYATIGAWACAGYMDGGLVGPGLLHQGC